MLLRGTAAETRDTSLEIQPLPLF
ncbi:hypothetical protein CGRA01v4_08655 [Colletotrichum graminicola]|nr:hypothetical protein CGRA01v4_08655 [Colletotrichum graminicola]